ncbi:hypothetical protein KM043_005747 [Ampulex compressa]|nr:hypothetical protein KM043_005747 [Ampulex compressa]
MRAKGSRSLVKTCVKAGRRRPASSVSKDLAVDYERGKNYPLNRRPGLRWSWEPIERVEEDAAFRGNIQIDAPRFLTSPTAPIPRILAGQNSLPAIISSPRIGFLL